MKKTTGRRHLFPPFDRFFLLLTLLLSAAAIAFSAGALPPEQSAAIPSSCENLQLGIPGEADRILDREGFALGYLNRHGQAAWVIYRLTRARLTARPVERCGSFRRDPALPAESVTPADYRRSGYDRGHLAPAADMAFSARAMRESFFMSNISPQKREFNRGIWKRLEQQVRRFALHEGEIMVITGPVLPQEKTVTIGRNKITVPPRYYKVIYDLTPPRKMIAFLLPAEGSSRPLQEFAVTVDEVEKATGLDFFSLLPQHEQELLESSLAVDAWTW